MSINKERLSNRLNFLDKQMDKVCTREFKAKDNGDMEKAARYDARFREYRAEKDGILFVLEALGIEWDFDVDDNGLFIYTIK